MSAGKRLAKRSIVGTRVCAAFKETGYYHPGVIVGCKNPEDVITFHHVGSNGSTGITANSKYIVKFESNGEVREYVENEIIGPGFKSMNNLKLRSGQKIFITHNGREVNGTVIYHQQAKDEVLINIQPQLTTVSSSNNPIASTSAAAAAQAQAAASALTSPPLEIPIDVTKKLDEVRLLESRKSARLLEQDFIDFARLADVAERKRNGSNSSSSNNSISTIVSTNNFNTTPQQLQQSNNTTMMTTTASIDVPRPNNLSRKRRPSSGHLFQPLVTGLMQQQAQSQISQSANAEIDGTDECAAAMVLMSLSCSPHSPHWDNGMISSSWSSSSSGASSWLSGGSFGNNGVLMPSSLSSSNGASIGIGGGSNGGGGGGSSSSSSHSNHSQRSSNSPSGELFQHISNFSPTPSSSDDGIESDNGGAASVGGASITTGSSIGGGNTPSDVFQLGWDYKGLLDDDQPRKKKTKLIFKCTWPGCTMIKESCFDIEAHVRYAHLGPQTDGLDDHEEEFYYTEVETSVAPKSIKNRQKSYNNGSNNNKNSTNNDFTFSSSCSSSSPLGVGFMAFSPTLSHMDMVRPPSEDPEYKSSQLHNNSTQRKSPSSIGGNTHHHPYLNNGGAASTGGASYNNPKKRLSPKSSPVRRPRGDTKKCRKVYGMDHRELWCTQCKWKKACTRFSD